MENIFWRELKDECKYCKEKENLEICKPYFDLCTDILSFIHSCQGILNKSFVCEIVRHEYARGGEMLHRGFYYPSLFSDLVIGNCSRGHILKSAPRKAPDYIYSFNKNNQLILSEKLVYGKIGQVEKIIYENHVEYGLTARVGHESEICYFTKRCFEDGKLMSYVSALIHPNKKSEQEVIELIIEKYNYVNGLFASGDLYRFYPSLPSLDHNRYFFERDTDGFLTHYSVKSFKGEMAQKGYWDNHIFEIDKSKRRK